MRMIDMKFDDGFKDLVYYYGEISDLHQLQNCYFSLKNLYTDCYL